MMTPRFHRQLCTVLLFSLSLAPIAAAQEVDSSACGSQVYAALAHEERQYRAVVFGQKSAANLPVGSVQYDKEGNTWMKTGESQWQSLAKGYEGTTWSNTLMNEQMDVPVRRGILETRKALTSELIPPLAQSLRALQCRMRAECVLSRASETAVGAAIKIQPDGCMEFEWKPFPACKPGGQQSAGVMTCDDAADSIMDRETVLLRMIVTEDAAYRTLLQFEGIFQGFLSDFRFSLLSPLWQTVRIIGGLTNIPCFLSQCNE